MKFNDDDKMLWRTLLLLGYIMFACEMMAVFSGLLYMFIDGSQYCMFKGECLGICIISILIMLFIIIGVLFIGRSFGDLYSMRDYLQMFIRACRSILNGNENNELDEK